VTLGGKEAKRREVGDGRLAVGRGDEGSKGRRWKQRCVCEVRGAITNMSEINDPNLLLVINGEGGGIWGTNGH
jgi:hypothetical protein